jgi:hypothetical protein
MCLNLTLEYTRFAGRAQVACVRCYKNIGPDREGHVIMILGFNHKTRDAGHVPPSASGTCPVSSIFVRIVFVGSCHYHDGGV